MTDAARPVVASEVPERGIGLITIQRPEKLNALNLEVKRLIEQNVRHLSADEGIGAIIITGGAKAFVAGADIAEMRDMTPTRHLLEASNGMFEALRASPKILIAAVEGYALGGGCELAMSCDIIIAGETAVFGQPEVRVGIMPGGGGTQLMLRAIGKYRTMLATLTGEKIPAAQALAMGMISELVPDGSAMEKALSRARTIVAMPRLAVSSIKEAVKTGQDMPLSAALASERALFRLLFDTADQKEGMEAFLEKRQPVFTGR